MKFFNYVSVHCVEQNLSISILDRRHISWKFPPGFRLSILHTYFPLPRPYFSIWYYQRIVRGCVAPTGPRTLPLRHTHGDVEIKREGSVTKTEALRSMLVQAALSLSFVSYWACKVLLNLTINIEKQILRNTWATCLALIYVNINGCY